MAFLLAAFVTLYLWPDDTGRLFAWTIRPRMTPLLMGSGYLAGAYFFLRAALGRRWHRVGLGLLAVSAFAAAEAAATLLHWERFHHGHPWFFTWLLIYGVTPILVPLMWLWNRQTDSGLPEPDDVRVPALVRGLTALLGVVELLFAGLLLVVPERAAQVWPWALTPLTARVIGGWLLLPGVGAFLLAAETRWSSWRVVVEGSLLWSVLLLVGIARAWADFDFERPAAWVFAGGLVCSTVGMASYYLWLESRRRRQGRSNDRRSPADPGEMRSRSSTRFATTGATMHSSEE
jgi:hypothetical protein